MGRQQRADHEKPTPQLRAQIADRRGCYRRATGRKQLDETGDAKAGDDQPDDHDRPIDCRGYDRRRLTDLLPTEEVPTPHRPFVVGHCPRPMSLGFAPIRRRKAKSAANDDQGDSVEALPCEVARRARRAGRIRSGN
jgi:hypothetical protein